MKMQNLFLVIKKKDSFKYEIHPGHSSIHAFRLQRNASKIEGAYKTDK